MSPARTLLQAELILNSLYYSGTHHNIGTAAEMIRRGILSGSSHDVEIVHAFISAFFIDPARREVFIFTGNLSILETSAVQKVQEYGKRVLKYCVVLGAYRMHHARRFARRNQVVLFCWR